MTLIIILSLFFISMFSLFRYLTHMPGSPYQGDFRALTEAEQEIKANLLGHVRFLSEGIGPRASQKALDATAAYITAELKALGYEPTLHEYDCEGRTVSNIEAQITGSERPGEIVIIGAHYDTVPETPGADDNASGVAALLETARILARATTSRTLRFVFFVNEEPPWFKTSLMGSRAYAAHSKGRKENITAMLSLEMLGVYSHEAGSQAYPFPFSMFYPDTADFIAFVGTLPSRALLRESIRIFRERVDFPSEGLIGMDFIPGIDWSDHWSFQQEGYPAIMLTDTSFFRYAHYHGAGDTPEKLSYDEFSRVVLGVSRLAKGLAR